MGCRQKPATGMECASPHMSATPVSVKALMIRSTLGAAAACSDVCRGCSVVCQIDGEGLRRVMCLVLRPGGIVTLAGAWHAN